MVADDSLVWDMLAMADKLSDGNHGVSTDIVASAFSVLVIPQTR